MKKLMLIMITGFTLQSCTEPTDAKRILEDEGYTEIQITGYRPWACSEEDHFSTGFKAKNHNGKIVKGTVCGACFKGHTIRLD